MTAANPSRSAPTFFLRRLDSPIGDLCLVTDAAGRIRALEFADREARMRRLLTRQDRLHILEADATSGKPAVQALGRYFDGDLQALDALEVSLPGSPLQEKVWRALRTIPVGQVTTYGDLARRIGMADLQADRQTRVPMSPADADEASAEPAAEADYLAFQAFKKAGRLARAVGHANSLNPVAIIVPCHRVIGASGQLTGYAGGLPRKQWLLAHERAVMDPTLRRLDGF